MGIIYNKTAFTKAGITKAPETWSEFIGACDKLKAAGITPFSLGGLKGWMTMRFTDLIFEQVCGPALHKQLNALETSWDCTQVVQAYQTLKDWTVGGYFPQGFLSVDPGDVKMTLYQGTAAMTIDGSWYDFSIKEDGQDISNFDYIPLPNDVQRRLQGFGEVFGVTAKSEFKDECMLFTEFFLSKDIQEKYQKDFGWISPRLDVPVDAATSPFNAKCVENMKTNEPYFTADTSLPYELVAQYFEVQDAVIGLTLSPADAAKKMQNYIQIWKDKNKKS